MSDNEEIYQPPPGPPPGWNQQYDGYPHQQPYFPPQYQQPPNWDMPHLPGRLDVQRAAIHHNPAMHSIGPAGARDTHRYDQMRHAQNPYHGYMPPPAVADVPPLNVPPPKRFAPALPPEVMVAISDPK